MQGAPLTTDDSLLAARRGIVLGGGGVLGGTWAVGALLALEEEFGTSIPDEDAANLTSYALLKVVLEELLSET